MIFVLDVIDHQFQVKVCWGETHIKAWIVQALLECKTLSNRTDCSYRADDVQFFSKWHVFGLAQEWYRSWQETSTWHPNPSMPHGTSYSCKNGPLPWDIPGTCCGMWGQWKKVYMGQASHVAWETTINMNAASAREYSTGKIVEVDKKTISNMSSWIKWNHSHLQWNLVLNEICFRWRCLTGVIGHCLCPPTWCPLHQMEASLTIYWVDRSGTLILPLEVRRDTHQINCLPVGGSPYMLWVSSASFTDDRLNLQGMSFSCKECGFHHRHKSQLTRHMRIHTQETFVCHVCRKPFSRRDKLNCHIIHKHQTIMDTKQAYPCSQCGKLFSRKFDLKRHKLLHTSSEKTPTGVVEWPNVTTMYPFSLLEYEVDCKIQQ